LPAVCVRGLVPGETIKGSWVRTKEQDCICKRRTYMNALISHESAELQPTDYVWTHKGCVHNEVAALRCRHQLKAPACQLTSELIGDAKALARRVLVATDVEHLVPITKNQVVSGYSGGKRRAYEQARLSLMIDPLNHRDAGIRMFIKADKSHDTDYKAPRAIQYRTKRYGLSWSQYVQPMEHALYGLCDWTDTPICAKGRNAKQRARDLLDKSSRFANPVFLCLDHSKFDAHITQDLLRVESAFYQALYHGKHRRTVRMMMRMQMVNKGSTKNGTRYCTPGTRMSGEASTALGGTTINILVLQRWLSQIRNAMYVDGDDSVVIVDACDLNKIPALGKTMQMMSMETKLEQMTTSFEEVEFCQCRPVETVEGWRMVRNPLRVLSRAGWSVLGMPTTLIRRWVRSVGLCELVLGRGVPILQRLGSLMAEQGAGKYFLTDKHHEARMLQHTVDRAREVEITEDARASFARAWGVDPATQIMIEETMSVQICGHADLHHDDAPHARHL